jgi:hypothetical protein
LNGSDSGGAGTPADRPGIPPPPPPVTDRERLINRVVVAFLDGTRTRGFVYDVNMRRGDFHLYASDDPGETRGTLVHLKDCKGVFFVRSLTGNPNYRENKTDLPERRRWGRPFDVVFHDGEHMVGTVEIFHEEDLGFYLIPPDPKSNNLRIFVIKANTRSVKSLEERTGDGTEGVWEVPDPATYAAAKRSEVVLRLLRDPDIEKLSLEVYLPVPVLEYWKKYFLDAAREALTDESLAAARKREDPDRPPDKPDRTPPDKRLEIVIRLSAKEDQAVLSQVFLVPFKLLLEWRERALDAGKEALRRLSGDEANLAPEVLRARYEALLVVVDREDKEREDFLDSLADVFNEPKK